jgi:hypothetical protein
MASSFLSPCSDCGGAFTAGVVVHQMQPTFTNFITYLRTRLTLGSGNKGGEAFKVCKHYLGLNNPGLPRQSDDGVTIHFVSPSIQPQSYHAL